MPPDTSPESIVLKIEKSFSEIEIEKYLAELAGFRENKKAGAGSPRIVLGSKSPRRKLILGKLLGIEHECVVVEADEQAPRGDFLPEVVSKCLAVQKFIAYMAQAEKVMEKGNVLIVSDTVVVGGNGEIIGKEPETLKTAEERYEYSFSRIMSFVGKPTAVCSSVVIADFRTQKAHLDCDKAVIFFRPKSPEVVKTVERYCRHVFDREKIENHRGPVGKAGSFGIQEPEILALVEKIEGDITVAVGLPAELTLRMLGKYLGLPLPETYDPKLCVDLLLGENPPESLPPFGKELRRHALDLISHPESR